MSWRPGHAVSSQRMFCLIRNRWWVVIRYFSILSILKLAPMLLVFEGIQLSWMTYKGFWREWLRALGSTLRHLPLLFRQRRDYQRRRKTPDADILKLGPLPLTTAMVSGPVAARAVRIFEATLRGYVRLALPELSKL